MTRAKTPGALARFSTRVKAMLASDAASYFEYLDSGIWCDESHVKKGLRLLAWARPADAIEFRRLAEALAMDLRGRPGVKERLDEGSARLFFKMDPALRQKWREELALSHPEPGQWGAVLLQAIGPAAAAQEAGEIGRAMQRPQAIAAAGPKPSRARL